MTVVRMLFLQSLYSAPSPHRVSHKGKMNYVEKTAFIGVILTGLVSANAQSLKCVSHYESYRNKVKYAGNESYTEIIEYEKNKTQTIKSTVNGKIISHEVTQDVINGQTTNYSNINNNLVRTSVTVSDQQLSSAFYAQNIKNLGGEQYSKEIRTSDLEVDLTTGEMSRTSTIENQREKYFTIQQGNCVKN